MYLDLNATISWPKNDYCRQFIISRGGLNVYKGATGYRDNFKHLLRMLSIEKICCAKESGLPIKVL